MKTKQHLSLTHDFRCPNCKAPHFGSKEKHGVTTYHCHGLDLVDDPGQPRARPPCGWSGPAEACFTELKETETIEIAPGVELDEAVAKAIDALHPRAHNWEVTGLADYECSVFRCKNCGDLTLEDSSPSLDPNDPCVKPYSSTLDAAFEAAKSLSKVMSLCDDGDCWDCTLRNDGLGVGQIGGLGLVVGRALTPALAICAALLKLKEVA